MANDALDLVTQKLQLYPTVSSSGPGEPLLKKDLESKILTGEMARCMAITDWFAERMKLPRLGAMVDNIESRFMCVDQKSINNYIKVVRPVSNVPEQEKKGIKFF